jgi:hypothetical protein
MRRNSGHAAPRGLAGTLLGVCAAVLAGGCYSDIVDIRGEDRNMSFPTARVAYDTGGPFMVEAAYSRGDGASSQTIPAGRLVDFADVVVLGPAPLSSRYAVAAGHVALAHEFMIQPDRLGLLCRFGAAVTDLRITANSGATVLGAHDQYGGLLGGCGLWLEPVPRLRLEWNSDWAYTFTSSVWADWNRVDLTLGYRLVGQSVLFGGYRWWWLNYDNDNDASDLGLDMGGPVFGVALRF